MFDETQLENREIFKNPLPNLPYTYKKTSNAAEADYKEWRLPRVTLGSEKPSPKTDDEIVEAIRNEHQEKSWFTSQEWREKGLPEEQIEFIVDNQPLTIYNYNKEQPFTEEHLQAMQRVLQKLGSHFPQVLNQLRWILIDNTEKLSGYGDPAKYPINGTAIRRWQTFKLYARGMDLAPHRVTAATNFEGTVVHESAHLIQDEFKQEWDENYQWAECGDYSPIGKQWGKGGDDWEIKPTPDGQEQAFFNTKTGEMAPQGIFPLQPEECVTFYAKINSNEDKCESVVAYLYDPQLLESVSMKKFSILKNHDAQQPQPEVTSTRIPKDRIALPEVKPEVIKYFIEE